MPRFSILFLKSQVSLYGAMDWRHSFELVSNFSMKSMAISFLLNVAHMISTRILVIVNCIRKFVLNRKCSILSSCIIFSNSLKKNCLLTQYGSTHSKSISDPSKSISNPELISWRKYRNIFSLFQIHRAPDYVKFFE